MNIHEYNIQWKGVSSNKEEFISHVAINKLIHSVQNRHHEMILLSIVVNLQRVEISKVIEFLFYEPLFL